MERVLDRPVSSLVKWDWEKTLYVILIVLALGPLLGLGDRVQSHDESIHTRYSWNLYTGRGFAHDPLMHGPFLFHATAFTYFLFGDSDFTARVPVALMGVALVAFPYLLRRWLGRAGALATSVPPHIARHRLLLSLHPARHPGDPLCMVTIYGLFSYLRDGRSKWLAVIAAGDVTGLRDQGSRLHLPRHLRLLPCGPVRRRGPEAGGGNGKG